MVLLLVNFNSIKVRLEPNVYLHSLTEATVFQFHKGTIRTGDDNVLKVTDRTFQFHKGTIRTVREEIPLVREEISIP